MREWNKYAFIDYIYGGMTVSVFVGMDFTNGNKPWKDPYSLHYVNPNEDFESEEEAASATKTKTKKARTKTQVVANSAQELNRARAALEAEKEKMRKFFAARDEDNEYQAALRMSIGVL